MNDWHDGNVEDGLALRVLCQDLGEEASNIEPGKARIEELRAQISVVLEHMGGHAQVYGFGELDITSPSVSQRYEKKMLDTLCDDLRDEGLHSIADRIECCQVQTGKSGGLRITRERKR